MKDVVTIFVRFVEVLEYLVEKVKSLFAIVGLLKWMAKMMMMVVGVQVQH